LAVRDKASRALKEVPTESRTIELSSQVWELIREGMRRCVNSPGGTALTARVPGIEVAGKTGTAQNPHGKDHAWFVGFAPYDHPKIAICVLVENAGFGGVVSAPIAGLCIEKYIYHEIVRQQRPLAPVATGTAADSTLPGSTVPDT